MSVVHTSRTVESILSIPWKAQQSCNLAVKRFWQLPGKLLPKRICPLVYFVVLCPMKVFIEVLEPQEGILKLGGRLGRVESVTVSMQEANSIFCRVLLQSPLIVLNRTPQPLLYLTRRL